MPNFNKDDVRCHPIEDSVGAGIIMDVDLEQLIRESERLRICEQLQDILTGYTLSDALMAILSTTYVSAAESPHPSSEDKTC